MNLIRKIIVAGMLGISAIAMAQMPYRNPALSPEERAADLCSRLTLDEKVTLMMNGSKAIDRFGIPAMDWWNEALHGVGRNGLATVFPSCIGMAASFDDDLIEAVFTAVSDEARAKNTYARANGEYDKYKGLSFWTPNINVFRDPRWGRGQETYGEDPYMNGRMGSRVVRGLQGDPSGKYLKLLACAKHYAVHSGPEKTRHSMNIADLPPRDLWETYLPAFKTLVKDAGVREVMCAYQRYDGAPCCGSNQLLQSILRDEWGFDGLVVSDCGAINDFYVAGRHGTAKDAPEASAQGVIAGTDVECGGVYRNLKAAVERGDITEDQIDVSVRRLLAERFRVGELDDDSLVEWTNIPMSVVSSPAHRNLARQMGREQMVLLKNNGVLPLKKDGSKIVVMGPNAADSVMCWGIYYGQPAHTVTVLEGIESALGGKVAYAQGCGLTSLTDDRSVMDKVVRADGKKGFRASYWNNTARQGQPVVVTHYNSPLTRDNGGNTSFENGVNLTDFSTRMEGTYTAEADGNLNIAYGYDDTLRIVVNGDTILNRREKHGVHRNSNVIKVKKGEKYDFTVDYVQLKDGASLSFDLLLSKPSSPDMAVEAAGDADIVIFVGGISPKLEKEEAKVVAPGFDNGDRTSIELPQAQRDVIAALHEAGKKVVLVNCSGSAVALAPETRNCDAILQAWYPGEQGGHAVADILFGDYNPSGKLPVTFYSSDAQLPDFDDYRMKGRTYRYMTEKPLYAFGHGLSYTNFSIGKPKYKNGKLTMKVTNTGKLPGTEVVQVYLRRPADVDGPTKTLRGYKRVALAPGEERTIEIDMPRSAFETWSEDAGRMEVIGGNYILYIGNSSDDPKMHTLNVKI